MNQDALLVMVGATLATVVFTAGFAWEVRRWRRQPQNPYFVEPRSVDVRAVGVPPESRRGPLHVLWGVIGASIGMYLVRRLLGRPSVSSPNGPPDQVASLDEDDIAGRIGAVAAPGPVVTRPTRIVVAGSAVTASVGITRSTAGTDAQSSSPGPDRRRFYRDTSLAVAGLVAVVLLAVVVLPSLGAGNGQVLSATGTPESSDGGVVAVTASPPPADVVVVITPSPNPTVARTLPPAPSVRPAVAATPRPTPRPTRKPTGRPVATPRPTPMPPSRATPTPAPTATPTPTPTPAPATPTPAPTAAPTPTPTPDPATPTPAPTV